MRLRRIAALLTLIALLLCGCAGKAEKSAGLTGTWQSEIEVSVLGLTDQNGNHLVPIQLTLKDGGTGTVLFEKTDATPENTEEFSYSVKDNTLTFNFELRGEYTFSYVLKDDSLTLDLKDFHMELSRVK